MAATAAFYVLSDDVVRMVFADTDKIIGLSLEYYGEIWPGKVQPLSTGFLDVVLNTMTAISVTNIFGLLWMQVFIWKAAHWRDGKLC